MISIHSKTLEDLEFTRSIRKVFNFSLTEFGKKRILQITPISNKEDLHITLIIRMNTYLPTKMKM